MLVIFVALKEVPLTFSTFRSTHSRTVPKHRFLGVQLNAVSRLVDAEVVGSESTTLDLQYVLPIGPACPFRSAQMEQGSLDSQLARVVGDATMESGDFALLAAQAAAGIPPDPRKSKVVGQRLVDQGQRLKKVLDDMELAQDFQAVESYYTMEFTARNVGTTSMRVVEKLMTWQGQGLMSMADGRPPPPFPPGLDPAVLASAASAAPGPAGSSPRERVCYDPALPRSLPFTDSEFDAVPSEHSASVKAEYEKLVQDHQNLVKLGETYGSLDNAGKQFYLDESAAIKLRWQNLFANAGRAGVKVTPLYEAYSEELLKRSNLSVTSFLNLVETVHRELRRKADQETFDSH